MVFFGGIRNLIEDDRCRKYDKYKICLGFKQDCEFAGARTGLNMHARGADYPSYLAIR